MLWLMERSGLIRHIHLDSWVSCVPDVILGVYDSAMAIASYRLNYCLLLNPADVVSIPKTGENFRLLYDTKGRFRLHSIRDDEAKVMHHRFQ